MAKIQRIQLGTIFAIYMVGRWSAGIKPEISPFNGGFIMKRIAIIGILVLGIAVLAAAKDGDKNDRNNRGMPGWGMGHSFNHRMPMFFNWQGHARAPRIVSENVNISGELTIVQGSLAVKSGDITYIAAGLIRYAGFIDALKDGARVSIAGSAIANPRDEKTKYLIITKLTIAGKEYDLGRPMPAFTERPERPDRPDRTDRPDRPTPPAPPAPPQPRRP